MGHDGLYQEALDRRQRQRDQALALERFRWRRHEDDQRSVALRRHARQRLHEANHVHEQDELRAASNQRRERKSMLYHSQRIQKEQAELAECTFKPCLDKPVRRKSRSQGGKRSPRVEPAEAANGEKAQLTYQELVEKQQRLVEMLSAIDAREAKEDSSLRKYASASTRAAGGGQGSLLRIAVTATQSMPRRVAVTATQSMPRRWRLLFDSKSRSLPGMEQNRILISSPKAWIPQRCDAVILAYRVVVCWWSKMDQGVRPRGWVGEESSLLGGLACKP